MKKFAKATPSYFLLTFLLVVCGSAYGSTLEQAQEYYEAKKYSEAFRLYDRLAKRGYAEAQYHLGVMYDRGLYVPVSKKKSLKWWFKASKRGHAPS